MKDKLFDNLPEEQKFDELSLENLQMVNDMLETDGNNCIIMDDMGAYLKNLRTVEIKILCQKLF
jgi:hypothetical protein